MIFCFFFFFSSRRRHTRCLSDWSSDVCSSDLQGGYKRKTTARGASVRSRPCKCSRGGAQGGGPLPGGRARARSEERRVGKEWRSRWATCHEKKKTKNKEGGERERVGDAARRDS